MARRFGIKITKGVRINFGKTGTSVTFRSKDFFGRSHSSTVRLTGGSSRSSSHTSTRSRSRVVLQGTYTYHIDDNGTATFFDPKGQQIYDESTIRKLKSSESFKAAKRSVMEKQKQEKHQRFIEEQNERYKSISDATDDIVFIHKMSANVISEESCIEAVESVRVKKYELQEFNQPKPMRDSIERRLFDEAERTVNVPFWKKKAAVSEYVAGRLDAEYNRQIEEYNANKAKFEEDEQQRAIQINRQFEAEAEGRRNEIRQYMNPDTSFIENKVKKWLDELTLTIDLGVDIEYNSEKQTMVIDLDLPNADDMPKEKAVRLSNGTVKAKNKTQKELKEEYIICVFGLAVFVSSHIFNVSTAIKNILVSGYTNERNAQTGNMDHLCIYSVIIPRYEFEDVDLGDEDPQQLCLSFENHANITTKLTFKNVEPLSVVDMVDEPYESNDTNETTESCDICDELKKKLPSVQFSITDTNGLINAECTYNGNRYRVRWNKANPRFVITKYYDDTYKMSFCKTIDEVVQTLV